MYVYAHQQTDNTFGGRPIQEGIVAVNIGVDHSSNNEKTLIVMVAILLRSQNQ
jgi:hypothetical protein